MRIGFDAKRLFFNKTGLGVYSRNLLLGLENNYAHNEYLLFAKNSQSSKYYEAFKHFQIISGSGPLWRTKRIAKDVLHHNCDLYHGLSHELPLALSNRIPTVVTIHDVIFKRQPDLFPKIDRWIYDKKWRHSCQSAHKIIAVSEHTKHDIVEFYNIDPKKIIVISPPIDLSVGNYLDTEAVHQNRIKHKLPATYFLYVGAISQRKNLLAIIQAMHQLRKEHRIPLVVVGTGPAHQSEITKSIANLGLQKSVYFMGHIANRDLAAFYAGAQALIYPSFYEGFGIPIVESLKHGTPVITSNISSMPEAAGPGAILINPYQPNTVREAMERIAEDSKLRSDLAEAGKRHIQKFDITAVSAQTEALYRNLKN